MKRTVIIAIILNCVLFIKANSQTCSSCTQTLNTISSTPIFVNPGQKLCITSTGQLNATLYIWGGEVCNDGVINGMIEMTDGVFSNNGQISSGMNVSIDKGVFINNGSMLANNISLNGGDLVATNNGTITGTNFQLLQQTTGAMNQFINNGIVHLSSILTDSTKFYNNNSVTTSGQLMNSDNASFFNYGYLKVGANFTNKSYFYTECMIIVGGLWANNVPGFITGPTSGCGGFSAKFSTSNFSDFGTDGSNLDMCDSSNIGSFNFNSGNIGSNVTYCSCANYCQTTSLKQEQVETEKYLLYPNPVIDILNIKGIEIANPMHFIIYNYTGQVVFEGTISPSIKEINVTKLSHGFYLLYIDNHFIKFIK